MCGIAGELRQSGERSGHVAGQLECLRHRGPDADGVFERPDAWVGQTRLSVIDLESGDPPITNEDGTIGVALNGEIYNYRELRKTLREQGHAFSSDGDTEVIVHLAETLDPVALADCLDGMFALAVWDDRRRRMILARDRFGKKPLYYWTGGGRLVFGSEIKSVLANPHVPRRLRSEAIEPYLTFGYVPTPDTFFEGVRSVPQGHVLVAEPGREPRLERYWQPPIAGIDGEGGHLDLSLAKAAREVRSLLDAAVRRRLVSDVPLGAFLSGGIDSSAIVGIMARELDRPVQTFTIGFEDSDGYDERPFARLAAAEHVTDHHEFVVHPHAVDLIERLVWHHDQPFGDSSAIPTFLLSELTRERVTVALTGDGGDELFAGYERFAAGLAAHRYAALPRLVQRAVTGGLGLLPAEGLRGRATSLQRFARVAGRGLPDAYCSWISYVGEGERDALLDGRRDDEAMRDYRAIWDSSAGAHPLDRLLDLNMRTYLLDDLLVKVDRTSMAHGLEVRSPFLDPELLAFTSRLPPHLKARGMSLKRVLRAAVDDLLPAEIMNRPKRGFGVPLDRWFREDLHDYLGATLGAADARVNQHLAPAVLDRLLAEHDSGARNHGHVLWTLLTLEVFLRRES
ncbi:MAG: asparagine synthase (glutamine-hydrolyzing) [Solirubrobacteraceae bacterium]